MSAADRLFQLERRLRAISDLQHKLSVEREQKLTESLRLRLSLTNTDRTRYEALRMGERLETEVRA